MRYRSSKEVADNKEPVSHLLFYIQFLLLNRNDETTAAEIAGLLCKTIELAMMAIWNL